MILKHLAMTICVLIVAWLTKPKAVVKDFNRFCSPKQALIIAKYQTTKLEEATLKFIQALLHNFVASNCNPSNNWQIMFKDFKGS